MSEMQSKDQAWPYTLVPTPNPRRILGLETVLSAIKTLLTKVSVACCDNTSWCRVSTLHCDWTERFSFFFSPECNAFQVQTDRMPTPPATSLTQELWEVMQGHNKMHWAERFLKVSCGVWQLPLVRVKGLSVHSWRQTSAGTSCRLP